MLNTVLIIGIVLCIASLGAIATGKHIALTKARRYVSTIRAHLEEEVDAGRQQAREIRSLNERITAGKAQNDRLLENNKSLASDRARLESQLMHALATMDSTNKVLVREQEARARETKAFELAAAFRKIVDEKLDGVNSLVPLFKEQTDRLFINAEELRAQNAGLLETVTTATSQLVTIAQEFAGLRRVGFMRGAEVAVNSLEASEPPKYQSTDAADEYAAKTRGGAMVIDASE
jgi:chromosome segregation ATPase